jgi:hypothetical protein
MTPRAFVPCLALFWALAAAPTAQAEPMRFDFTSGSGFASISKGTSIIGSGDLGMNGEFITVDSAAGTLDNFKLTFGPSELITLSTPYGGFDSLIVDNLVVMPSGVSPVLATAMLPDGSHVFALQSVAVSGTVTAFSGQNATTFSFEDQLKGLSATVVRNGTVSGLMGIGIGIFPGELVNEAEDLTIKLDVAFAGEKMVSAPIPEPSSVILACVGALIVGGAIRRSQTH